VPLIIHETTSLTNLQVTRTSASDVYAQIVSDLTESISLPKKYTGSDAFRATGGAARSLLLSVSITRQQWSDAITQYNAIINGGYGYDLETNYADLFSSTNKFTQEHIFDANYIADGSTTLNGKGNTNILSYISAPVTGFTVGDGVVGGDADAPIVTLRSLFKSNDKRTQTTFADSVVGTVNGKSVRTYNPHFYKYWDTSAASNIANNGVNAPIIRFAEVILFYAEAQNELNGPNTEAYSAINKVRNRAGLADLTSGLTKDQFRDSLFLERNLEFVYEQIRWFDLIRTNGSGKPLLIQALKNLIDPAKGGNASDTWTVAKANNVSEKFYLLPIPASEITANPNLTQNPNW
jgi:starch-binding outer membrane protein, SusD/RagB family